MPTYQFDTLDISVQDEFDKFLEERGINESLAFFVPDYAEYKEQKVRRDTLVMSVLLVIKSKSNTLFVCSGVRQVAEQR